MTVHELWGGSLAFTTVAILVLRFVVSTTLAAILCFGGIPPQKPSWYAAAVTISILGTVFGLAGGVVELTFGGSQSLFIHTRFHRPRLILATGVTINLLFAIAFAILAAEIASYNSYEKSLKGLCRSAITPDHCTEIDVQLTGICGGAFGSIAILLPLVRHYRARPTIREAEDYEHEQQNVPSDYTATSLLHELMTTERLRAVMRDDPT